MKWFLALFLVAALVAVGATQHYFEEQNRAMERQQALGSSPSAIATISHGEEVNLETYAIPGAVTMFDFYADWCGPCKSMDPHLRQLANSKRDVYLRKIDIKSWNSDVAEQYSIRSIPSVWIVNPDGMLVARKLNGFTQIEAQVLAAR